MATDGSGEANHHEHLGIALSASQALESVVTATLAAALGVSPGTAAVIGGSTGIGRIEGMLRGLAGRPECNLDEDALRAWLPVLTAAIKARHRLVHQVWFADYGTGVGDTILTKDYELVPRDKMAVRADVATVWEAIKTC